MLDIFQTLQDTSIATAIREGNTLFPWIESIHVLAIVTVVGTISIIDMRLIGLPAHRKSVRKLMQDVLPLTWGAFALAVLTGSLLFSSRATKYVTIIWFVSKMVLLLLAGLNMVYFHIITYRSIHLWDELAETPRAAKIAGTLSLLLWIGVVFCGRLVGFVL